MPRIRTIKPKFWDDIKISKISRDARLLFIGMWNFSDDLGVIVADQTYIKSKVFPYDKLEPDDLDFWLKELITKKFIIHISNNEEDFYFVRNFIKHQQINKPNHSDICIDKEELTKIMEESRINTGIIQEMEGNDTESIRGGREGKGRDSKGKESKGKETEDHIFWESEKKQFFNSGDWIFKFCTDKDIPLEKFDKKAKEFISNLELKEDFKDLKELKRHFTNWYDSKNGKNGFHKEEEKTMALPHHLKKLN